MIEVLDKIEIVYQRKSGLAKLYDGNIVEITVYCRINAIRGSDIDKPPSERYIDNII